MPFRLLGLASLAGMLNGCVIVTDVDADWDWVSKGGWTTRNETVVAVDHIEFNARGTLYITQGDRDALRMEGHESALDELTVEHENGTLVISQSGDNYRWFEIRENGKEPIYTLQIADLRSIRHDGHGEINVGPFTIETLNVATTGQAKTNFSSINARSVAITVSHHGYVSVETLDSDTVELATRDHGDVYIEDANVLDASVQAMGHGEVFLAGRADSLNATLRDHTDLDSSDFATAVTTVRVRDFSKALVKASDEVMLDERDHASVVVTGPAKVQTAGES